MTDSSYGQLINGAKHGRYLNPDAPENLIRYVTRTNGMADNDLIAWGGLGITEFCGIEAVISQFYHVQRLHTRKGGFGRYMDHEIFSFSTGSEESIQKSNTDIDKIARKMAYDFYDTDHCQVVYGIHRASDDDEHMLHIHFAINTVNYRTGNKRRENTRETHEREARFQKIVEEEIKSSAVQPSSFIWAR